MKVLITGASGMLGQALLQEFIRKEYQVVGVSGRGQSGLVACDLRNQDQCRRLFRQDSFQAVIHAAAFSDVDGCENDPRLAYETNALSAKYVAEGCLAQKIPLIYISTDYVFDGLKNALYETDDSTGPVNIYGMTKLAGEYFARQPGLDSAVVRTSWLFGAGNPKNFVNVMVERLKKQEKVSVLADQVNSPTSVNDLAQAVHGLAERMIQNKKGAKRFFEIFQVCNAGFTTRHELTLQMKDCLGLKRVQVERLSPSELPNRAAIRPKFSAMSSRYYETFFQKKMRPWQESLAEYLKGF